MNSKSARQVGLLIATLLGSSVDGAEWSRTLRSPDGHLELRVDGGDTLRYAVSLDARPLLKDSEIWLSVDGVKLGPRSSLKSAKQGTVDRIVEPPVRQRAETLRDHFNELRLETNAGYSVTFR